MKKIANLGSCLLLLGVLLIGSGGSASAYTSANAQTIASAFDTAFYNPFATGKSRFLQHKGTTPVPNWKEGVLIECFQTVYDRTNSPTYQTMISNLLDGFQVDYGTSWSSDGFNDDICWMCMAFIKGYQRTGNTTYRTIAKNNFDMMYARAWDTAGGGGLWWNTSKTTKNSAVNCPATIVAYFLYQALGDSSYLTKATAICAFQRTNHFDETTGIVSDSLSSPAPLPYTQGTFAGGCWYLGQSGGADKAISYLATMGGTIVNGHHIMPQFTVGDESAEEDATGILWAAKYMIASGTQSHYLAWLQTNAQAAWNVRRTSDNLSWCDWGSVTPNGTSVGSWDAVASMVALQVVPPTQ